MDKFAFSVPEFCAAHGISRATLYNLLKAGTGSKTMKVKSWTLISREAAEAWRRQCETASIEAPATAVA